jgi:hypothetical protein
LIAMRRGPFEIVPMLARELRRVREAVVVRQSIDAGGIS